MARVAPGYTVYEISDMAFILQESGRETDIAKVLDALIQHNPKKDFVILTHAHFSESPHSHF